MRENIEAVVVDVVAKKCHIDLIDYSWINPQFSLIQFSQLYLSLQS